jgi:hypothetical protein
MCVDLFATVDTGMFAILSSLLLVSAGTFRISISRNGAIAATPLE